MVIKKVLNKLTEAFNQLVHANEEFLNQDGGTEDFRNLIDQRNLVIEDLDLLATELSREINIVYRDHSFSCKTIPDALRALAVLAPELADECDKVKEALARLVESDKKVEKFVSGLKESVKAEIQKIRKGSRILKGYKQADPMGSCFINKIK
ncbi:MAG: hypothetical protein Kow0029_08820 [Candidatus Rifleibacteriota bacterium]